MNAGTPTSHTFPRTVIKSGYVLIRVGRRWMFEHRWVMEQVLGRALERGELVHHRDGCRNNNTPSNLEVQTYSQHAHHHKHTRRPWGSVLHPEKYPGLL